MEHYAPLKHVPTDLLLPERAAALALLRERLDADVGRERILDRVLLDSFDGRLREAGLPAGDASSGLLTSALGSPEGFDLDVLETPQLLASGDVLLLCSDGLWSTVDEAQIAGSVAGCNGARDWLDRLESNVRQAARGDQDNYSALALWCGRAVIAQ